MPGFSTPARDIRSHRALAALCVLIAVACIAELLVIGFRAPTAALKQGQSTWIPGLDGRAR